MARSSPLVRFTLAAYGSVLALYPREVEPAYRHAMLDDAHGLLEHGWGKRGHLGVLRLWPGLFADVLLELMAAHARNRFDRPRRSRFEPLRLDLKHAVRALVSAPASTALIVLLLTVAAAAQAMVLATVDGILLQPLPYASAGRLVTLHEVSRREAGERHGVSPGNVLDWRAETRAFDAVAAWATSTMTAATAAGPIAVQGTRVTTDFFRIFDRPTAAGRTLEPDDFAGAVWVQGAGFTGGPAAAVISERLARQHFGGAQQAIDQPLVVDGHRWQVIGVVDQEFEQAVGSADLWLPWNLDASYRSAGFPEPPRTFRFLEAGARLAAGATLESAQAELATIASRLEARHAVENAGWGAGATAMAADLTAPFAPTLLAVSLAIQLVLALAGANVASLLVSRNLRRSRNFAIRSLLGAARIRVVRQIAFECALLVGLGGLAGLLASYVALPLAIGLLPAGTPRTTAVVLDGRSVGIVAALGVLYAIALTILGCRQCLPPGGGTGHLREVTTALVGQPRTRVRSAIVTIQVALALIVIVTGGLIAQSLVALERAPLGFTAEDVTVARIAIDQKRYDSAETAAFFERLISTMGSTAGVTSAAAITALPLSEIGADFNRPYWPEGRAPAGQASEARITTVTPGYLETLGIPLLAGRDVESADRRGGLRVILINQALSERAWPGEPALGQNLVVDYRGGRYPYRVVGVVGDTLHDGARRRVVPEIFIPHAQNAYPLMNVVIKSPLPVEAVASAVVEAVSRFDQHLPVQSVTTMTALRDRAIANERLAARLLLALAIVSLLIATVGLYGVVSLSVSNRQREIALRMALGASRSGVYVLFFKWALVFVFTGCLAGVLGAMVAGRQVAPLLFQVHSRDPLTFATAVIVVLMISAAAILLPVRRAATTNPAVLLRSQ